MGALYELRIIELISFAKSTMHGTHESKNIQLLRKHAFKKQVIDPYNMHVYI